MLRTLTHANITGTAVSENFVDLVMPEASHAWDEMKLTRDTVDKLYFRDDTDLNRFAVASAHAKNMLGLQVRHRPKTQKRLNSAGEVLKTGKGLELRSYVFMKKHTGKGKPILEPKTEKKVKKKKKKKDEESSESSSSSAGGFFGIADADEKKEDEDKRKYERPWDLSGKPKPSKYLQSYDRGTYEKPGDMPAYQVERVNLFQLHGKDNWYSALQPPKMKYIKQLERMREKHRVLFLVDMIEEKRKKKKDSLLTAFYKPPLKEVEHKRIDLTTMANADELLKALRHPLPQVFICGKRVGGMEEINKLNKTGELKPMLD